MYEDRYEDKILICRECGREFLFTAAEQEFYEAKGFSRAPRRCKECRRSSGAKKQLYKGVCAACGREAQVPFPLTPERLIYCRDCYSQIVAERKEERKSERR